MISENDVMVFSKSYCGFSLAVKRLLDKNDISYSVLEMNLDPYGQTVKHLLHDITDQWTSPNVFIHGQHIGGYTDTAALGSAELLNLVNNN